MIDTQTLLNADGTASMSTLILMSHHAFRRDVLQLERALSNLDTKDAAKVAALQNEWTFFRGALHGHHVKEDTDIFPSLLKEDPKLRPVIDELMTEHKQ